MTREETIKAVEQLILNHCGDARDAAYAAPLLVSMYEAIVDRRNGGQGVSPF